MNEPLDFLLPVFKCPKCAASRWRVNQVNARDAWIICDACAHSHRFERGILWVHLLDEHQDVTSERVAVKPSEGVPELGGWNERYESVERTSLALRNAYLSLPYGDGGSHFAQPGYFANVKRFAKEFDFIASQLPTRGLALDIGADGTWSTARMAARGLTCIALDITDHLVLGDLYQTRYPRYARINVDMHESVFVDEAFDVVTAFNALHHSRRLPAVVERIAAMLKPGGILGFVEPYVQNPEQERAFGAPQSSIGISENIHTIQEWDRAFHGVGLSLTTYATSQAFCAIYTKAANQSDDPGELLKTDRDGCFVNYYRGSLLATPSVVHTAAGLVPVVQVKVTNESPAAWASRGPNAVNLGYHVEQLDGSSTRMLAFDNPRTPIDNFLMPGESRMFDVQVELTTPGTYRIEFDLVHEGRSWFKDRGSQTAVVTCVVQ